jgi:hypothetical protein
MKIREFQGPLRTKQACGLSVKQGEGYGKDEEGRGGRKGVYVVQFDLDVGSRIGTQ